MLLKGNSHTLLPDSCHGSPIRIAQYQFLCLIIAVLLICFCINHRLFLFGKPPMHIRLPYAVPKTFITSECGDERRLGNNMFTYASMLGIANRNNMTPIVEEGIRLQRIFVITALTTDDLANTMGVYNTFEEYGKRGSAYDITLTQLNTGTNVKLLGYLQSWRYFSHIETEVRRNFIFKDEIKKDAQKFLAQVLPAFLKGEKPVLVGVHIRRGDMTDSYYQNYGYVTAPVKYFHNGMNYFRLKYSNVKFIICSDDIRWAKEHLAGKDIAFSEGNSEAVDLAILSSCDHSLISVGSFGWWAAWIVNGTTIYYKNWPRPLTMLEYQVEKRDYFPPHWIPME